MKVGKKRDRLENGRMPSVRTDAERNEMVVKNIGLAAWFAAKYMKHVYSGLEFSDLVQEACIGLITAAEMYDFGRGVKFSAYASRWIRQSLQVAIESKCPMMPVPRNAGTLAKRFIRIRDRMHEEAGFRPEDVSVLKSMEVEEKHWGWVLSAVNGIGIETENLTIEMTVEPQHESGIA